MGVQDTAHLLMLMQFALEGVMWSYLGEGGRSYGGVSVPMPVPLCVCNRAHACASVCVCNRAHACASVCV